MPSMPRVAATGGSPPACSVEASSPMGWQAARTSARATAVAVSGKNFIGNSSKDVQKLDVENQGGVWADRATRGAAGTVAQGARNPEAVLAADRHQGHALGPARDDLPQAELRRLASIV